MFLVNSSTIYVYSRKINAIVSDDKVQLISDLTQISKINNFIITMHIKKSTFLQRQHARLGCPRLQWKPKKSRKRRSGQFTILPSVWERYVNRKTLLSEIVTIHLEEHCYEFRIFTQITGTVLFMRNEKRCADLIKEGAVSPTSLTFAFALIVTSLITSCIPHNQETVAIVHPQVFWPL